MALASLIKKEHIKVPMTAQTKTAAVNELLEVLKENGCFADLQTVKTAVFEREALSSTGLGDGIAVPHAKTDAISAPALAIGISKEGIDFQSHDGEPAYVVFLMIAPKSQPGQHIEALSEIAKMMQAPIVMKMLKKADTAQDVIDVLSE